jgi:hypothetical protein
VTSRFRGTKATCCARPTTRWTAGRFTWWSPTCRWRRCPVWTRRWPVT